MTGCMTCLVGCECSGADHAAIIVFVLLLVRSVLISYKAGEKLVKLSWRYSITFNSTKSSSTLSLSSTVNE